MFKRAFLRGQQAAVELRSFDRRGGLRSKTAGGRGPKSAALLASASILALCANAHAASLNIGAGQTYTVTTPPEAYDSLTIDPTGTLNLGTTDGAAVVISDTGVDTTWSGTVHGVNGTGAKPTSQLVKVGTGTVTFSGLTADGGEIHIDGGTAVQSGTNNNIRYLTIGSDTGNATFNISGGTLNILGGHSSSDCPTAGCYPAFQVGDFGGTGVVNQTAGDVNLNVAAFNIGNQAGDGTYNLSGGTITVSAGSGVTIGRSTKPTRNSTGLLNISGDGFMDVKGGPFVIGNVDAGGAMSTTQGTVTQTGGVLEYEGTGGSNSFYIGGYNNGTYNLNGGVFKIGGTALQSHYLGGLGTANFNLGGGTIEVIGSALDTLVNATLVAAATSTIDTNGLGAAWNGVLSGGGSLRKTGAGTLTLTKANTYTGTNYVDEGTLALTGAGSVVNSSVDLESSGTSLDISGITPAGTSIKDLSGVAGSTVELGTRNLAFGTGASTTFNGNFDGTGSIEKDGTGTFTFGGNAGSAQSFVVDEGTLLDTTSNSFNGVGNFLVAGGATWDLGGAGTQTFTGVPVSVEIGNSATVNATLGDGHDKIVGTTVKINNSVMTFPTLNVHGGDGNFSIATPYELIKATTSLTGVFGTVTDDLPFLTVTADYSTPNELYLDFSKIGAMTLAGAGTTPNEMAVGGALDNLPIGNPLFDQIATLNEADALAAIVSMEGDLHASARSTMTEGATYLAGAVEDHVGQAHGRGLWLTGYGHALTLGDASGNAGDVSSSTGGLLAGLDLGGGDWFAGVGAGYARGSLSADSHSSSGNVDGYSAIAYAGGTAGMLKVSAGGSYTANALDTTRTVVLPMSETLTASYNARTTQAFGEVGIALGGFEPFAGANYINVATDGFKEDGGLAAITAAAGTQSVTFTTVGMRAELAAANGMSVNGMAGWRHAFGDVTPMMDGSIQGQAFSVAGVPIAADTFVAELGLKTAFAKGATLDVSYVGQIAAHSQDNGAKATAAIQF